MHSQDLSQLRDFWLACSLTQQGWPEARDRYEAFHQLVQAHNVSASLMGPGGVEDFYLKHIADSLAILQGFGEFFTGPVRLADVGSGAGLPGIALAVALGDLQLTAIESNQRKAKFIRLVAEQLGLAGRIEVVPRRSRELGRNDEFAGRFDIVAARAVASADKLVRGSRRLLAPGGAMILYKTPSAVTQELPLAQREAGKSGLTVETSKIIHLPAGTGDRQFIRIAAPA